MTRVLIVDDSPVDRRLAGRLLETQSDLQVQYAASGGEALAIVQSLPPDLVLTDLQMPDMDGLALVDRICHQAGTVPVIIMTAHGSEEIAMLALQHGAAGYVPKSELAASLMETVDNVLTLAQLQHQEERLQAAIRRYEAEWQLDNDLALIASVVGQVQAVASSFQLVDATELVRLAIAVEEALRNGLLRGNLEIGSAVQASANKFTGEAPSDVAAGSAHRTVDDYVRVRKTQSPYKDRKLHVTLKATHAQLEIRVKDDGPGFDLSKLPDPTNPHNMQSTRGRGLLMMKLFVDELRFNEQGNEVTLIKRRSQQPQR